MSSSTHVDELLTPYLDGVLTPEEKANVDEHLAHCEQCRSELESLTDTVSLLRQLPSVGVSQEFEAVLRRRLKRRAARRVWIRPARWPVEFFLILMITFATLKYFRMQGKASEPLVVSPDTVVRLEKSTDPDIPPDVRPGQRLQRAVRIEFKGGSSSSASLSRLIKKWAEGPGADSDWEAGKTRFFIRVPQKDRKDLMESMLRHRPRPSVSFFPHPDVPGTAYVEFRLE